ncbi:helix-turn-helix transcriptional regulator [Gramella sp. MAR_2010_147]|uniref:helix-turn-helix domain-containing protein n=1 Tax=Gramella sp. MAR_2010_147 TaxID=1250205 RepID=UPI00087A04C9|nr:helix-turn-helix transcriptional regulator [Gramella sp. MAR_2010_147]SDR82655.1 DNA-binding transcriptional regulator, XRE-family HTH domain [Gramella sp. MAR_2010_147]
MVNTEKFASRLNKILEYHDISAASFADKIEVGRSSISHILSGRNKPSLDFVMKVVKNFPEVELYWLLNGKGNFPSTSESQGQTGTDNKKVQGPARSLEKKNLHQYENENPVSLTPGSSGKTIQKIVIFYTDGSFEAFEN